MLRLTAMFTALFLITCTQVDKTHSKFKNEQDKKLAGLENQLEEVKNQLNKLHERSVDAEKFIGSVNETARSAFNEAEKIKAIVKKMQAAPKKETHEKESPGKTTEIVRQKIYVTPEDFGAIGNDRKDDTEAFEKLAEAIRKDVAVVIPAKRYIISRTWELPYMQGGKIIGMGGLAHHPIKLGHPLRGPGSEIVWEGEEGGVMVKMRGSNMVWNCVSLYGNQKAGVGLFMTKDGNKGLGTGKQSFRGIAVHGCKIGIRLSKGGANVDSTIYEYTYVENCDVGLMLDAGMVMGHYLTYFHPRRCKVAIWVRRGGDLVIRGGLNTSTGTFLKLGDTGRRNAPGRNNGMVLIEGIKTDAQDVNMTWLETVAGDCAVTFKNCHQAWTKDGNRYPRKWILKGSIKLTIRDSVNLFGNNSFVLEKVEHPSPKIPVQMPNVLLDRCRVDFGSKPEDWIEKNTGCFRFLVRDCYRGNGRPIPDADVKHDEK